MTWIPELVLVTIYFQFPDLSLVMKKSLVTMATTPWLWLLDIGLLAESLTHYMNDVREMGDSGSGSRG